MSGGAIQKRAVVTVDTGVIRQPPFVPERLPLPTLPLAIVALFGIGASPAAWGFGFGPVPDSVVFGRALDVTVPLRLEAAESAAPGCLAADVHIGERQLPAAAVRVVFMPANTSGQGAGLRVHSAQAVDEPVLTVQLRAGCAASVSRRFVVFADPQTPERPSTALAVVAPLPREATTYPTPAAAGAAPAPRPPVARRAVAARHAAPRPSRIAPVAATVASKKAGPVQPAPVARLRLDEPELLSTQATADAAVRSAQEAAVAAGLAASAAAGRVVALEQQLQALRGDAAARQASLDAVRTQLSAVRQSDSTVPVLLALSSLLGAAVAWLGWRLHGVRRNLNGAWNALASSAAEPVVTEARADGSPLPITEPSVLPAPAAPLIAAPSSEAVAVALQDRPATVEDLLDLEQQAEFFIMLGQDDAAVELLMAHLRGTGGTSALPYLKLLEIHKRCGEHEAYERLRTRFNRRFNAYAPQWSDDLDKGLSLLDYPLVSTSLQAAWPTPAKAMAQLQALLYRKGDGDLFDLPAYRDLLVLYAVARDLAAQGHSGVADVDVLLPADEDAPRMTQALISSFGAFDTGVLDDRVTAPVDLDLGDIAAHGRGAAAVTATLAERV